MPPGQSPSTRQQCDVTKLIVAGYELELNDDSGQDFYVTFHGPKGTAYESGVWRVHVTLPKDYPFASPSIGFANKILHPNIDETSGTVCLDVINQTWTPLYSLVNVFDIFLPQLLTYPNAADPLNAAAGSLLLADKAEYESRIRDYVRIHASYEAHLKMRASRQENAMRYAGLSTKLPSSHSSSTTAVTTTDAVLSNSPTSSSAVSPTKENNSVFGTSTLASAKETEFEAFRSSDPEHSASSSSSFYPYSSRDRMRDSAALTIEQSKNKTLMRDVEPNTPLSDLSLADVAVPEDDMLLDDDDDDDEDDDDDIL